MVNGASIPYRIVRSARRHRTIQISVRPGDGVTVRAPLRTAESRVQALVEERAGWIARRLAEIAAAPAMRPLVTGAVLPFLGEPLRLELRDAPTDSVDASGGRLVVACRASSAATAGDLHVRDLVTRWYSARATEVLRTLCARWALLMGVTPRRVIVKDQRRRWGSCGADGTLRFNWRLVMAEPALIELVVVHELAHLRHRNHSAAFWAEVARAIPDLEQRRVRLRKLGRLEF
jgi:predicted metal-dependent hydrolase